MRRRSGWCGLLCAGLLAAAGCSGSESGVEGLVTLDGKPVDKATVTFSPVEPGRPLARQTGSDGTFKLTEKAKPGNYKVTVVKTDTPEGGGAIDPSDPEQKKRMQEMMTRGQGKAGRGGHTAPKSLVPEEYGDATKTPFKV